MDVLDVHVVIRMEAARPDPEFPVDPGDLPFAHDRTETRDLGGPFQADDAHSATITITRCLPTQNCPGDTIVLAVDTLEADGDAVWLVQWPWAWVEPPSADARRGDTWSGSRRVAPGATAADFGFDCTLVERRWKGGHVRCTGAAEAVPPPPCFEAPCPVDLGGRYTLDVRTDWITGDLVGWKHAIVTLSSANGTVARRTVTTTARVTRGPSGQ